MRIFIFLVLGCSLIFTTNSCRKKKGFDPESVEEFESFCEKQMEKQHIPGMSVLIFRGEEELYIRHFGESDLENSIPLDDSTVFLMASVSKTITAVALLQLYEKGLFNLDDPINDYLSFAVKVPEQTQAITFRHLLTHTSGISDGDALDGQYYYGQDSPILLKDFMEDYLVPGGAFYDEFDNFNDFAPGSDHQYSNVGNALIGVLVEEISGVDFNTYCKNNIFLPLGMSNTHWRLDEVSSTIAIPYEYSRREYLPNEHYTFTDYPNGGLRSNAHDMFQFLSILSVGGTKDGFSLLKSNTINEALSLQVEDLDKTMGLSFFLMSEEHDLWGHDGGETGVSTTMAFNKQDQIGAIILTNMSDVVLDGLLISAYQLGEKL